DVRVLYLTHFVGFAQPVAEARHLCDQLGVKLIEDCALALFSRAPDGLPLGARGDAAIFCLYKTLPLPHGGLLLAPSVPWSPPPAQLQAPRRAARRRGPADRLSAPARLLPAVPAGARARQAAPGAGAARRRDRGHRLLERAGSGLRRVGLSRGGPPAPRRDGA